MAIRRQIITETEVLRFSPAGEQYPATHISKRILQVEMDVAANIWGCDFADYLETHLTPPESADEWQDCKTYSDGDFALRSGIVYESTADNNRKDPLLGVDWIEQPRFDTDCLNELFVYFMRPWLAHRIYAGTLEYTTNATQAGGLVKRFDDSSRTGGTRTATVSELQANISTIRNDEAMIYGNMIEWLKKNAATCDFPEIKALSGCAINPLSNTFRRKAWR